MKHLLPVLMALALLLPASCNRDGKTGSQEIISEKIMVNLLIETHLADAILAKDVSGPDYKRDQALFFYPSVLEKYGVTKVQMDSSISWYIHHPMIYARIYDNVLKELEKKKTAVQDKELIE